jgi:hypothetical protein
MTMYVANATATLSASTTRTIVQLLSSTQPLRIKELGVSFDGTDASLTPIKVDLVRQTSGGTASTTGGVPLEQQEIGPTSLTTYRAGFSSTEPTTTDVIRSWYVTPAGGLFVMQFPLGDEPVVGSSGRIALRCITGSSTTPNVAAYIVFDE